MVAALGFFRALFGLVGTQKSLERAPRLRAALRNCCRFALCNDAAAINAALRAQVYHPVCFRDHVKVVLDDDDGVAGIDTFVSRSTSVICRPTVGSSST